MLLSNFTMPTVAHTIELMDIATWLSNTTGRLKNAGDNTARLDCLVLLEDATGRDRGWLLAHPEFLLLASVLRELNVWVERRVKHEPLAYIRGKSEFYGREFIVTEDTLQPRPESETIITLLKELILNSQKSHLLQDSPVTDGENVNWVILDVGMGSGCLGITAKLELPDIEVIMTDISPACLKVAKANAKKHSVDIRFLQGDLLQPIVSSNLRATPDIIIANLPYVPDAHTLNAAAMHEPDTAIFGGQDGLDLYLRFFRQIADLPKKPLYVLTESLPTQHRTLKGIAETVSYKLEIAGDFIQVFTFKLNGTKSPV